MKSLELKLPTLNHFRAVSISSFRLNSVLSTILCTSDFPDKNSAHIYYLPMHIIRPGLLLFIIRSQNNPLSFN
jgi:hypothetical protein